MRKVAILLFFILFPALACAELVKYIDENGQAHFVDTDYQAVPLQYLDQIPQQIEPLAENGEEPGDTGQQPGIPGKRLVSFTAKEFTDADLIRSRKSCPIPDHYTVEDLVSPELKNFKNKPIPLQVRPPQVGQDAQQFLLAPDFFQVLRPGNDIIIVDVFGSEDCPTCNDFMGFLARQGVFFAPRSLELVNTSDQNVLACLESCREAPCVMINHRECLQVSDNLHEPLKRIVEYELYHRFMIETEGRINKTEFLEWLKIYRERKYDKQTQ